jgi:HAD superfamily phosphoserine phosphatase-like hydrolase
MRVEQTPEIDMSRIRLVIFDLDGTLLRGDTVCEVIARSLGFLERMRELEATVKSHEEIRRARDEMAGWYTDHSVADLLQMASKARLAPGTEEACAVLRQAGVEIGLASLTWEFAVAWYARKLRAESWLATSLAGDGTIGHVWPEDKGQWLEDRIELAGLSRREVAAVGDSAGDVALLNAAGLPVFVGRNLVGGLPDRVKHMPDADLRDVARLILDESTVQSSC